MEMLTTAGLARAESFVMSSGRPLDQAMWRYLFDEGSAGDVTDALAGYRNGDGGFGHALESDLRAPESSALATQTALDVLHRLGDPSHPLVDGAVAYLVDTFDAEAQVWRFTPISAGEHPHAPWWNQERLVETFEGFTVNPRAKLLGYLLWADRAEAADVVDAIYDEVVAALHESEGPLDVNALDCLRTLVTHLRPEDAPDARRQLRRLAGASVETDDAKWGEHCLRPLDAVSGPDDPVVEDLATHIQRHLDFEVRRQRADGSWGPTWSWYGSYPEMWPQAERDWSGYLTVETVRTLTAFGRVVD